MYSKKKYKYESNFLDSSERNVNLDGPESSVAGEEPTQAKQKKWDINSNNEV